MLVFQRHLADTLEWHYRNSLLTVRKHAKPCLAVNVRPTLIANDMCHFAFAISSRTIYFASVIDTRGAVGWTARVVGTNSLLVFA